MNKITLNPSEQNVYWPESKSKNIFQTGGTFEGWYETIGRLSSGNSRLIFAISAAFAGPLLMPLGLESGGFNFVGNSSTGKSSALHGSASVWGKGSSIDGFVKNWRATENGLEGLAVLHTDTCLYLDEIGQAPARTIEEASYLLGNGIGKARAVKDGSLRENRTWNLIVLSTGEVGLTQKIREAGGRTHAGQDVRLIDVPVDAGMGMGSLEELHGYSTPEDFMVAYKTKFATTNYGHAGRVFIRSLQDDFVNSVQFVGDYIESKLADLCPSDVCGQVKRVARRFLLVAACGELAIKFNIVPWKDGDAYVAAQKCFSAWVENRGGFEDGEDMAICRDLKTFIFKNWTGRFWDIDSNAISPDKGTQAGIKTLENGYFTFYIFPDIFKSEIFPNKAPDAVARTLHRHHILLKGDSGYTKKIPRDTTPFGRMRCYAVRLPSDEFENTDTDESEKAAESNHLAQQVDLLPCSL